MKKLILFLLALSVFLVLTVTLVRGKPSAEKYTIVGAEDLPPDTAGDSVFVMTAEPPEKIRKYAEGYAAHAEEKWTVGCFIPYIGPKNLRRGQFRDTSYWCQMLDSNGKTAAFLVIHMRFGGKIGSVRLDPGHDLFRFSGVSSAEKPIYLYRQYDTLFAVCGDYAYLFLGDGWGKTDEMDLRKLSLTPTELTR